MIEDINDEEVDWASFIVGTIVGMFIVIVLEGILKFG
jgi:hypothetical protein